MAIDASRREPTEGPLDDSLPPARAISSLPLPSPLDGVPPWARLLLYRVWRGTSLSDARTMDGSKVSEYMVRQLGVQHPSWRFALDDAIQGVLLDCPVLPDDVTRAYALDEEQRRHELAMGASARYAAPYLHMGMEAQGRLGNRSSGPSVLVQGSQVVVQVMQQVEAMSPEAMALALDALEQRQAQRQASRKVLSPNVPATPSQA